MQIKVNKSPLIVLYWHVHVMQNQQVLQLQVISVWFGCGSTSILYAGHNELCLSSSVTVHLPYTWESDVRANDAFVPEKIYFQA